mgnify:CR=1 FL=1
MCAFNDAVIVLKTIIGIHEFAPGAHFLGYGNNIRPLNTRTPTIMFLVVRTSKPITATDVFDFTSAPNALKDQHKAFFPPPPVSRGALSFDPHMPRSMSFETLAGSYRVFGGQAASAMQRLATRAPQLGYNNVVPNNILRDYLETRENEVQAVVAIAEPGKEGELEPFFLRYFSDPAQGMTIPLLDYHGGDTFQPGEPLFDGTPTDVLLWSHQFEGRPEVKGRPVSYSNERALQALGVRNMLPNKVIGFTLPAQREKNANLLAKPELLLQGAGPPALLPAPGNT